MNVVGEVLSGLLPGSILLGCSACLDTNNDIRSREASRLEREEKVSYLYTSIYTETHHFGSLERRNLPQLRERIRNCNTEQIKNNKLKNRSNVERWMQIL
tara:strand:- start:113 stop:412 length:300 start_codon:yes stop_codon:yes gene_type:complete